MAGQTSIEIPGIWARSQWVRLRTLIWLRWIAIVGQIVAITVAQQWFGLQMPVGLCFLAVGVAIIANLLAIFIFPENKRLSETEAMRMLLFDLAQLSFLLFLTGGLHNPFSLLVLTPVTISATALRPKSTLVLGVSAIAFVTILAVFHLPLLNTAGQVQQLPAIFLFGFWAAILIGVSFLALYAGRVTSEINSMSEALLATQMALAREQKLTDLGGVVAAAAHELGTPLATIKLVSSELMEELEDMPELRDDAALIREQADRCRDILRSMGRAGKDDLHMRIAPLANVVSEAAEPHQDRGKIIHFEIFPEEGSDPREPSIERRPEIIHGLRNLIQNAVDFAHRNVWIEAQWSDTQIGVRIMDDGAGYSPQVLGRIGDPFVRRRNNDADQRDRPGYEGMGLGLFIAKTLLERSGAELSFANGFDPFQENTERPERCGAVVEVVWPRDAISPDGDRAKAALGENQRFEA
ncbi:MULTISPECIES: sensor histidine kinase RegB [Actibacterium]|uniref:histidine kinase n=1 Tax=Actibacterium naphthalenivorans TaxID=1614693 RepID=A0A840C984_9RHOB|nr:MULTISPECIES: ActS/PrrB/RegB family redox-sensitive histidine kinase [Actibacterium]MBB4021640.1 two-component system sensor histidine kinase RegB [Actibacterium naphthalenivorans]